jgi:putative ABC transport system permease protein
MVHVPVPLRHAVRRLVRARGVTAAAVLTLALGLAAATTVFAVVRGVLLRPLPYPDSERLVSVSHTLVAGGVLRADQSDATLLAYARHARAFSHFGGYQIVAAAVAAEDGTGAERVAASRATGDLLPALGVPPLAGRGIDADDDRPGAARVAVIGERLWTRRFGGDPRVLHRMVSIDGVPHEIVGIMPTAFRFPSADTELWLPMRLDAAHTDSATFDYQAIARLRDGVPAEAAADDLQGILLRLPVEFPGRMTRASIEQTHMRVTVRPLADVIVGDSQRLLWLVFGAAAFVLAIACANVTNLFLVRAESRQQGIAIQRALGAGAGSVLAEFACEALLVSAAGALLAIGLAIAGIAALRGLDGVVDLPRVHELTVDRTVAAAAILMAAAAAAIVTILPSWRYGAASLSLAPGASGQAATAARERHRARYGLVALQVALSLMLLAGSGLLARTVWRLRAVDPGFAPSNAISFRLALPQASYPDNAAAVRFAMRAAAAIAQAPGVRAAGVASKLPLDERGRADSAVFVEDRPLAPGALPGIHPIVYASPDYFAAAGVPIVEGRVFTAPDPPAVALEAVVSRAFAQRYWPGASPIGRRIRTIIRGPLFTIVGVAGDVHDAALDRPADAVVYCPLLPPREDARWAPRDLALVVRADRDAAALPGRARDAVRALDPSLPAYRFSTLDAIVAHAYAQRTVTLALIGGAAAVAMLLAAIGLYGVMAFVVTLRTREIGIRVALGAQPGDVRWLVWRQGIAIAAIGVAAGAAGAVAIGRSLAALLFEVRATDLPVLSVSAVLLLAVAAAASWAPARRAAAVDPATALRAD